MIKQSLRTSEPALSEKDASGSYSENIRMVTVKDTTSNISALRSQRFIKVRTALKKAVEILTKKYRVRKIILIGSLIDKDRFGFHSDIDLNVEGLSDKFYFEAELELLIQAEEFNIDIIPFENLSSVDTREMIDRGKVLYEKR